MSGERKTGTALLNDSRFSYSEDLSAKPVLERQGRGDLRQIFRVPAHGYEQLVHQDIDARTGKVADERVRGDFLQIPHKVDFLHAHHGHARGGTNDQQAAARTGAVREVNPKRVVNREVVHAHHTGHQRHVIHNGGQDTDNGVHQIVVAVEQAVQTGGKHGEMACALQPGNGQQNAEEEEDGGQVDTREHARNGVVDHVLVVGAVQNLGHNPQHRQAEHNAHVGFQVRDNLEDRHEHEGKDAEHKDEVTLPIGNPTLLCCLLALGGVNLALLEEGDDNERHYHGDQAGYKRMYHHLACGDLAGHPEHDGGHVADRAPRTAGVGRQNHHAAEEPAVVLVWNQLSQQRHHHDGSGQVVQNSGEEEGDETQDPQQFRLVRGLDMVGNDGETLIRVDQLHDGHRAHQIEENLGDVAQMVDELVRGEEVDERMRRIRVVELELVKTSRVMGDVKDAFSGNDVQHPHHHTEEQCERSLVNLQRMLQRNAEVSDNEKNDHQVKHNAEILWLTKRYSTRNR